MASETESSANLIDLSPSKDGGVIKEILREGEGDSTPFKGDTVSVHYVGTLESDGSKFDSSRDRDEQFEFTLGVGQVIKAWDLCVASMKKGELCKVICKGPYAYGESGSPPKIPSNATLVFEIELFSWKGEDLSPDTDGSIRKRIIKVGDGYSSPNDGAVVKVNLVGKYNGNVFYDQKNFSFTIGEGCVYSIPEGVERALQNIKKNEQAQITIESKFAFGEDGNKEFNVPPNATVEYDVHLLEFEKCKASYEMETPEKIEQSKLLKDQGTKFFKDENYKLAIKKYKKIIEYLDLSDIGNEEELIEEAKTVLTAANLNLSMCYLKLKDYVEAKKYSENALELDSNNVKGHFRLGQALLALQEPELALESFRSCLKLDEKNQAAIQQIRACQEAVKKNKEKEKKMYTAMFGKH